MPIYEQIRFIEFPSIDDFKFLNPPHIGETIFHFMRTFYNNVILDDSFNVYYCSRNTWVGTIHTYIHRLYGLGIDMLEYHPMGTIARLYIPAMYEYPINNKGFPEHRIPEYFGSGFALKLDGIALTRKFRLTRLNYNVRNNEGANKCTIDIKYSLAYYSSRRNQHWTNSDSLSLTEVLDYAIVVHNMTKYRDIGKYLDDDGMFRMAGETSFNP